MPAEPTEFRLARTGGTPVRFTGTLLAQATSRAPATASTSPAYKRWFELAIYRTVPPWNKASASGLFVASIAFRSTFRQNPPQDFVDVSAAQENIVAYLHGFDPCSPCLWTAIPDSGGDDPGTVRNRRRNEHARTTIKAAYDQAVGRLLAAAGWVEDLT